MKKHAYLLVLILLAAGGLRFYDLTSQSLWGDEAFSIYAAKGVDMHFMTASLVDATHRKFVNPHPRPRDLVVACIRNEGTPPLYYVTLAAWIVSFGSGDIAVRSLSALLGVLNVAALYLLGRRLFGKPGPALLAALFLAVSPLNIYFSQEVRAYIFANLLTILSSWLLLRAVEGGTRPGPWLLYGLSALAICLSFYFAALVLGAHFLYLLACGRRSLRPWIVTMTGVGLILVPWYFVGFRTQMSVSSGYAPAGPESATALARGTLRRLRGILDSLLLGPMYSRHVIGATSKLVIETGMAALLAGGIVRLLRRGERKTVILPLMIFLVPLVVITAFGFLKGTYWYMKPRYHMWESTGIILLAAASIATFGRAAVRALPACAICLFSLAAAPYHFYPMIRYSTHAKADFRTAGRIISEGQERGDIIIVNIAGHMIPLNIYYRGGLRQVGMAETGRYDLLETLERYTRKRERVWLLVGLDTRGHGDREIAAFLDARYPRITTHDLQGLALTLYERGSFPGEGMKDKREEGRVTGPSFRSRR